MKRKTLTILVISAVLSMAHDAVSQTYRVDSITNAVDLPLSQQAVNVPLQPGRYTITLTASDFRLNYSTPLPQRHVVAQCVEAAALSDYSVFTLNGIGDSRTLDWPGGNLRLFFVDEAVPGDNTGGSVVEVRGSGGIVGTYQVDGVTNAVDAPLSQNAVSVPLQPGRYAITLTASDFRLNYNTPSPQGHVVANLSCPACLSDYTTFTLNGVGDSKTFEWSGGDLRLFFVDEAVLWDNTGSSTVEVKRVLPPLSVSVAALALSWQTQTNETYQLQYSTVLSPATWLNLGSPITGTGTNAVVIDSILGQPQRFYRLTLVP